MVSGVEDLVATAERECGRMQARPSTPVQNLPSQAAHSDGGPRLVKKKSAFHLCSMDSGLAKADYASAVQAI